jgi:PE family
VSFVLAVPAELGSAATDLAGIRSVPSAAHAAAATQTISVVAAAEDEVSAAIAELFPGNAQGFQARRRRRFMISLCRH